MGFYCIWFSIKSVKNRACIEWISGFCECLARNLPAKELREKNMLEVEELCQAVSFASVSREGLTCKILAKLSALRVFKYDFLTLHPYYIYPHYPQKYERLFREKNPRKVFYNTHTRLLKREILILNEKSL